MWRYIEREQIPVMDLYLAKNGMRYRSLGCGPIVDQILERVLRRIG